MMPNQFQSYVVVNEEEQNEESFADSFSAQQKLVALVELGVVAYIYRQKNYLVGRA